MSLIEKFEKVLKLQTAIDPVEKPYESKYEARNIINELIKEVDESQGALLGGLYITQGIIDIDVEELSIGEINLLKGLDYLSDVDDRSKVIIQEIKVLNQLGILWCLREDYEKAYLYLNRSLESYTNYIDGHLKEFLFEIIDLFEATKEPPKFEEKERVLELLNTHTHYYLAQVYEKTGKPDKSAKSCHITLSKQLELKEFQHLDWSTNAAMLSQHYLANEDYGTTKRHLIASSVMLDR